MYQSKRLKDCTFTELTNVWNDAFSNYTVNFNMTVDQTAIMVRKSELSPQHSFIIFDQSFPVGFVLTSIKEIDGVKTAWNGGTGVSKQYQGQGIGKWLMEELLAVYQNEGVELATLEVLKNNHGAISLYERYGYQKINSLTVLQLNEHKILDSVNVLPHNYIIDKAFPTEVKNLSFYNHHAAWSSKAENIPNGRAIIIRTDQEEILGYGLYNEITRINGEHMVMLHQCEINPMVAEKRTILEVLIKSIYQSSSKKLDTLETGDFTAFSQEIIPFLREIGFSTVAERYLMNAKIV